MYPIINIVAKWTKRFLTIFSMHFPIFGNKLIGP